jgi:predicted acyltransferase (DUF342 family)
VVVTTDATVGGFRRIITSYGYAPRADDAVSERVVRQVVELDPVTFDYGVFAGANYGDGSASSVIGGIYTGGSINLGNAHDYIGDIYSRGNIVTGSNQKITGNLHASGNVMVTNTSTTVYGSVYAGGTITTGGVIRDTAQAGGAIGCSKVQGACMPSSPPPPVPVQQLPVFTWSAANYHSVHVVTGPQLRSAAADPINGVYHVTGDALFSKNDNLQMTGDLTIVATGNVSLPGKITNAANGSNVQLTIVAFGSVTVSNNLTIPSTITSLVYTEGSFDGKNSSVFSGVIYAAGSISLGAYSLITQAPVTAPGFDWTHANPQRFTVRNVSTREITGSDTAADLPGT